MRIPTWVRERRFALGLAAILAVGLGLRLHGLNWDASNHLHPDERQITMVASGLSLPPASEWGQFFNPLEAGSATRDEPNFWDAETSPLNPRFFAYGSLPLYLVRASAHLLQVARPLAGALPAGSAVAETADLLTRGLDFDGLALVGRLLSALIDTGTIYLTYLLGRRVFSRRVGLLAALLVTVTVFHIQAAHFHATDVPLTFAVVLSLLAIVNFAKDGGTRNAAILGLSVGLALAIKVAAAPLLLPAGLAFLARRKDLAWRDLAKQVGLSVALAAMVFVVTQPYAVLDWRTYLAAVSEQSEMVRGIRDYPYTRQYVGTPSYLYHITQSGVWAMGPLMGAMAWAGFGYGVWRGVRFRRLPELLLLTWAVPYFLVTGSFYVKFLRYLLPLFPILFILAARFFYAARERIAEGLSGLHVERGLPAWTLGAWTGVMAVVVASGFVYSLAFSAIYTRPHSRVQASEWMYRNIPAESVLALEHWDDDLPLGMVVDGTGRSIGEYGTVPMNLYEPDDEEKYAHIVGNLRAADYIVLASNRLYGSIPRSPDRYPLTTRYYELLFEERLGFREAAEFTSYPGLFGVRIVDDGADESFTVYDHPKVTIFAKERDLSESEFQALFEEARDTSAVQPGEAALETGKSLLLAEPVDTLPVVDDRAWNPLANVHPVLSVAIWWLAVSLLGLAALPLTLWIFRRLPDAGYLLSKSVGLLVVGYLIWIGGSLRLVPNTVWAAFVATGVLALASWTVWRQRGTELSNLIQEKRRLWMTGEAVAGAAFLGLVGLRILNPDLWQPWNGGEKQMEFAFLNAIGRSGFFPPYDPYFAGGIINYYYYGLHLVSVLIKLTGVIPSVAFNLGVATLFALTVANAFSLGFNLTRRLWAALAAAGFVALLGNLDGVVQIVDGLGDVGESAFRSALPGLEAGVRAAAGIPALLDGEAMPGFDYWQSSRVIPETINEFPYWSFLFADLHPHMIGIPFTLLALSLILLLMRRAPGAVGEGPSPLGPASSTRPAEGSSSARFACGFVAGIPGFGAEAAGRLWGGVSRRLGAERTGLWKMEVLAPRALLALTLGAVAVINTWDLPTYLILIASALALAEWAGEQRWERAAWQLAVIGGLAGVLYWPFFANYQALHVGVGVVRERTEFVPFLTMWGGLLFVAVSGLLVGLGLGRSREGPLRFLRLLWRRWRRLPRLIDHYAALVREPRAGHSLALGLLGVAGLMSLLLALSGELVLALMVPMVALAALMAARRNSDSEARFRGLLLFLGFGILLGVEVVYLRDFLGGGDFYRMNTLFKFYIQAWVLLGIAAAAGLPSVLAWLRSRSSRRRSAAWIGIFALLMAGSSIFLVAGTRARVADRFPGEQPALGTLDGMAYMTVGTYSWPDPSNEMDMAFDHAAIEWLLANVTGSPVIAEAPLPYYREWGVRVASYTGFPTLLGAHQSEQRYSRQVGERDGLARRLFETPDEGEAMDLVRALGVSYVYIGQLERTAYPEEGIEKFEELAQEGLLDLVYENPRVLIYRVTETA